MVLINEDGIVYHYLKFCYAVNENFFSRDDLLPLKKYDFCKLVRMSLIITPSILITQFILLPLVIFQLIFAPLLETQNMVIALIPLFCVISVFGVIFALIAISILINNHRSNLKIHSHDGYDDNIDDENRQSSIKQLSNFIVMAYWSVKKQFCPIVEYH